jgi:hypothetical protein
MRVEVGGDEKVIQYRLDRSRRDILERPQADVMEVALEEKAEVKVIRGPNSSTTLLLVLSSFTTLAKALVSNLKPSLQKVSLSSHSSLFLSSSLSAPSI